MQGISRGTTPNDHLLGKSPSNLAGGRRERRLPADLSDEKPGCGSEPKNGAVRAQGSYFPDFILDGRARHVSNMVQATGTKAGLGLGVTQCTAVLSLSEHS